ncbi:3-hydroxybutyryl-CoA dehydratase [Tistrella bauzanensis]|uniref:3-hydroxybutyryl-CoA dehydratase n=1 Tax=Tistrella bauzanensis TaxID=657419 RepID=A0ABQ1IX36_9PROT|nr:enoyl-CoA hydratase/isomerase family protein [Tistrella bauzanensis]GGB52586.1 3-hydroxybutyryl-CoA dehydratase [Tistrella bauzanensis]
MIETARLEIAGPRATLTLTRPAKRNALLMREIPAVIGLIDRVEATRGVRLLVLTGEGGTFCSGVAFDDLAGVDWADNPLEKLCERVARVQVPTICAMNGGVYGGGADLALACDMRIGTPATRAVLPPARIGVMYHVTGLERFVRKLGPSAAKRLLVMAEPMAADELLRIGFLDQLVAEDSLDAAVDDHAARIAELAPRTVRGFKRLLDDVAAGRLDRAAAASEIGASFTSPEAREGYAALKEKRPPRFDEI